MIIYRLQRDIDGYGGHMQDEYYDTYEKAKECISKTSPLWFHDNKWDADGMKECRVSEEDGSFNLLGIQYDNADKDEWSINWCRVSIEPIELKADLKDKKLYLLNHTYGYRHWLNNLACDSEQQSSSEVVKYCTSEKQARKIAARTKSLKHIARLWVRPEEERISPISGGENYLSIREVVLK